MNLEDRKKLHLAYKNVFDENNPDAKLVMDDLRRVCGWMKQKYTGDKDELLIKVGREETLLRIMNYSNPEFFENQQKETK